MWLQHLWVHRKLRLSGIILDLWMQMHWFWLVEKGEMKTWIIYILYIINVNTVQLHCPPKHKSGPHLCPWIKLFTCISEARWSPCSLNQKQIREKAPPVSFSWRAQGHHLTVGPLEHALHLSAQDLRVSGNSPQRLTLIISYKFSLILTITHH